MLRTCMSTVRGLRNSSWAISRFVRPTATQAHDLALAPRQPAAVGVGLRAPPSRRPTDSPSAATSRAASAASGRAPSLRAVR